MTKTRVSLFPGHFVCLWAVLIFFILLLVRPASSYAAAITMGPSFGPSIPSSATGPVDYWYEFAVYSSGEANGICTGEDPQAAVISSAKTSHHGTVNSIVVVDNGVAEMRWDGIVGSCWTGTEVETLVHCVQTMNGLANPPEFYPFENDPAGVCSYENGWFYAHLSAPSCDTVTDVFSNAGWRVEYTHATSPRCNWFFEERTVTCGCVGKLWKFFPMVTGFSVYYKISVHLDQGVSPPSVAGLGIPGPELAVIILRPRPGGTSPFPLPTNQPPSDIFDFSQAVSAGSHHTLAVKRDHTVWAWGVNNVCQLGDGSYTNRSVPGQVATLSNIISVAAGAAHSVALQSDGSVWAWGSRTLGQAGDGTNSGVRELPFHIVGLSNVISIAAGRWHNLALKSDGTVWSWGWNYYGQLGANSGTISSVPVQVTNLTDVVGIAGGAAFSLFVKSDGTLWGCGVNTGGQLGDMTEVNRSYPVQCVTWDDIGYSNIVSVAAGGYHTAMLKTDGTVLIRGYCGQEDELSLTPCFEEALPLSVTNVIAITSTANDVYALKSDLTVWRWQNGFGSWERIASQISTNYLSNVVGIAGGPGADQSFAITADLKLRAWGSNTYGQLGDGTTTNRTDPVALYNNFGL